MKHKASRLACGLLAAALLLGTAACAGRPESGASGKFKGDHAAKPTAAQEKTDKTAEDASPALPARPGKQKPAAGPDQTQYDDRLITDAYAAAGEAATEWGGSYSYEVRIPSLLCGSSDAAALNAEIMDIYGEEAKRAPVADTIKSSIGWESHWDGSLLSLELTAGQPDGEVYHDLYYFDFETQTRLTAEDVLTRMGLSWDALEPALIRTRSHWNPKRRASSPSPAPSTRPTTSNTAATSSRQTRSAKPSKRPAAKHMPRRNRRKRSLPHRPPARGPARPAALKAPGNSANTAAHRVHKNIFLE